MCSLLGVPLEVKDMDLRGGEHKRPEFLRLNPLGQVPVLVDGEHVLPDSNSILVYLATRYDAERRWYPADAFGAARVQRWLSVAAGELAYGVAAARRARVFGAPVDEKVLASATRLLDVLEAELKTSPWFAADRPTIADIALFTYVAHAPEGGLSLEGYSGIRSWIQRIEQLPGFVPMPAAPITA
jgi:glutathione S-transferase